MRRVLALWVCVLAAGQSWAGGWNVGQKKHYLVGFEPGLSYDEQVKICAEMGLPVSDYMGDIDVVLAETSGGMFQTDALRQLQSHPKIRHVEEDFYTKWIEDASAASFAEAPMLSAEHMAQLTSLRERLRGLASKPKKPQTPPQDAKGEDHITWGVRRVNAPAAWGKTQGEGVRVAVIDTGIDCTHPDLSCDLKDGVNFVNPKADPMDDEGHGTHVSGTIAARMDARYIGVAPKARVVPVKVLDAQGGGSLSNVIKGILWAADPEHHIAIANMSLGASKGSFFMKLAVAAALNGCVGKNRTGVFRCHPEKGLTIIAASGNGNEQGEAVSYPGAYSGVITVAASDIHDQIAPWSSRGPQVAFIAPGVDVWSTTLPNGPSHERYAMFSGTSMATPHVSGLAALAVTQGAAGPQGVLEALRAAAKPLGLDGDAGKDHSMEGNGMINAAALVK